MQNTNPLTEIGAIVLAALLILAGGLLLYGAKIDTAYAMSMFLLAAGIFAGNLALKAPSPAQQTQISTQQTQIGAIAQGQQQLLSSVLPAVVQAQTPAQPVPPMPVQPQAPAPFAGLPPVPQQPFPAKQSTFEMPVVPVQ